MQQELELTGFIRTNWPSHPLAFSLSHDNKLLAYTSDHHLIVDNIETKKRVYNRASLDGPYCAQFAPAVENDGTQRLAFIQGNMITIAAVIVLTSTECVSSAAQHAMAAAGCKHIDWHPSGEYFLADPLVLDAWTLRVATTIDYVYYGSTLDRGSVFSSCGCYIICYLGHYVYVLRLSRDEGFKINGNILIHRCPMTPQVNPIADMRMAQEHLYYTSGRAAVYFFRLPLTDDEDEEAVFRYVGCEETVDSLEFSNDRRLCAAFSSNTGHVAIISTETHQVLQSHRLKDYPKPRVAFASDQSFLLATHSFGTVVKIPIKRDLSAEQVEELFGDIKNASKTS